MNEVDKIKKRYQDRKNISEKGTFPYFMTREREQEYQKILAENFRDPASIRVMEIGAGSGYNLSFFQQAGIPLSNLYANELLEERYLEIKRKFPEVNLYPGNALDLPETLHQTFDVVFQSTVFTSILDENFQKDLAQKMMALLKKDGIILWYDFTYDNPNNPDVKGVSLKKVKELFPSGKFIKTLRVTLAPPIGRRVGKLYTIVNTLFPFLRTHLIAVIRK